MNVEALKAHDFFPLLDSRQEPSLVFFATPACSSCKRLRSILISTEFDIPDLRCFQVQAEQAGGLIEEYDIFHLPAIFLFMNGEMVGELQCLLTQETIRQTLHALVKQGNLG